MNAIEIKNRYLFLQKYTETGCKGAAAALSDVIILFHV